MSKAQGSLAHHPRAREARRLSRKTVAALVAMSLVAAVGLALNVLWNPGRPAVPNNAGLSDDQGAKRIGADTSSIVGQASASQAALPSKVASDPRFAFLLLGYGGGAHEGAYLTDSITVAIADPNQKTLALLSLPRDLWAPLLFDGKVAVYNKLNTAYAFARDSGLYRNRLTRYTGDQGAGAFVEDTVSRLLGVPVSNYVALDFTGFREMINTVGGIDVDVPATFSARYPANDDPSIDPSWIVVRFNKGREHMNGERAIQFARAREAISNLSEGSDFARSRRQRLIMEAFKGRLFEAGGLIRLPQLLAIAADHVDTDYAVPIVGQLSGLLLSWKDVRIYQTALTPDNYLDVGTGPNGTYVLVPSSEGRSWAAVRAFARRLWDEPATGAAIANTTIVVANATGEPGAGGRLTNVLASMGYRVGEPITRPVRTESRLVDRAGGRAKLVATQLAKDLGVTLALASEPAGEFDALILELGQNDLQLANHQGPRDDGAPFSAFGISKLSDWSPPASSPTPQQPSDVLPTASPSRTAPQRTASATPSPVATIIPAFTSTPKATALPSLSRTPTPASLPAGTPTATPTTQPTNTPSASITPLPAGTAPPATNTAISVLPTATRTAITLPPTATNTAVTASPVGTPTRTPVPTLLPAPLANPTSTPLPPAAPTSTS